jgi:hypothetical protein
VSVKGEQLRLGVFAVVLGLACVNALALWGVEPARWGYTALQACTGAAAMVCAGVMAFRNHGVARLWRLLVFAATASCARSQCPISHFAERPGGTSPRARRSLLPNTPVISGSSRSLVTP